MHVSGDANKNDKLNSKKYQSSSAGATGAMSFKKMSIISIFVFIIILIMAVLPLISGAPVAGNSSEIITDGPVKQETLRQVTVLMRHGERAPVDTYPNDPYINDSMAPYGWGQLTNKGRVNIYNTGMYLRNRYGNFLGNFYNPDVFWLQSTSSDRTKMTAMILASSLWIPDREQMFNDIPWQPVSFQYWTRNDDNVIHYFCELSCPLEKFSRIVANVIPTNYEEDCQVSDPNYVIPPAPAA